ncbi:MAG: O-sialoglycoprotein endopeptidase [Anaerovoracaceae bacterium]|jgi:N6-L-threonylcarbamoyladenine synthase
MRCVLGIDTSNYTTSAALVNRDGQVLADVRRLLEVKPGARGLRQSEALFQHVVHLPEIVRTAVETARETGSDVRIAAVAASEKPRPRSDSYMPCFLPGCGTAQSIAAAENVPYYAFSHQEAHIAALQPETGWRRRDGFLCLHNSGGTCELLAVTEEGIRIVGGSRDISFGQLIDRIGVALGMAFPAGREMDELALTAEADGSLPVIRAEGAWIHLSGIETAAHRLLESGRPAPQLAAELFARIGAAVEAICRRGAAETGLDRVLLVGGVSTSRTLRQRLSAVRTPQLHISDTDRGRDNAVGIALLGREKLWP